MRYFLLPDTHLGHEKVMIKHCARKTGFEKSILTNLMKTVNPGDMLIHMGDVSLGWSLREVQDYFNQVVCHKVLVLGNHDRHWSTSKWLTIFDAVFDAVWIKDVLISHQPRYPEGLNIHGHSHLGAESGWYMPDSCLLSLEENQLHPINLEKVMSWREKRWNEVLNN